MLSHPAFVTSHDRGDTEGVALLAEEGVSAVTGAEGPDFAGLGEVGDVLGLVAGPGDVFLAGGERCANGVDATNEFAVFADLGKSSFTHASHDTHGDNDVSGVRDFNTELRIVGTKGTHAEGDDVHGTALHTALVVLEHFFTHCIGLSPVVGGASAIFGLRADEGAGFNTSNVSRIGESQEGVRLLLGVQLGESATVNELFG